MGTGKEPCAGQAEPSPLAQLADLAPLTPEQYLDLQRGHHQLSGNTELLLSACRSTSTVTCCHRPTHLQGGAGWGTVGSCQ